MSSYSLRRRDVLIGGSAAALLGLSGLGLGASYAFAASDLETALAPRTIGNPDAPIRMEEYFSLSCSHCANFHNGTFKDLKRIGLIPVKSSLNIVTFLCKALRFTPMLWRALCLLLLMMACWIFCLNNRQNGQQPLTL